MFGFEEIRVHEFHLMRRKTTAGKPARTVRSVPQSRLCLVNRAAASTNVQFGDAARQRPTGAVWPLWADGRPTAEGHRCLGSAADGLKLERWLIRQRWFGCRVTDQLLASSGWAVARIPTACLAGDILNPAGHVTSGWPAASSECQMELETPMSPRMTDHFKRAEAGFKVCAGSVPLISPVSQR